MAAACGCHGFDSRRRTWRISVNPDAGDVGDYSISVQATSGSQSLTDLTAFQLAVEDLTGV
ncbi:MAG: hypothetical protein HQ518_09915 [Rhodopirellula sp.]|nr:hypothetical protein [Rhodopirellula sp.]